MRRLVSSTLLLEAAAHASRAVLARCPQATSLDDPMLSYALGPSPIGSNNLGFAQKIERSQNLPWPGKLGLRGEVAFGESEARREGLRTAKDRLVHQAKVAFFEFDYAYQATETNEVNKTILQEFKRTVGSEVRRWTASKQDAFQTEVAHNTSLRRWHSFHNSPRPTWPS